MAQAPGKTSRNRILRGSTALLTLALAAAVTVTSFTGPEPLVQSAQAQDVSLTVQFRTALEPHGRWTKHRRWGEVWIPSRRDRDWRPYTVGRWTYTDEWGWYWVSDEDFGWVTYHYGRWVFDPEFGWVWIPGNEWGPAWVQWRYSDRHAGWAPLPPQEVVYEYDEDPNYWVFVGFNNFTAPNIVRVVLPPRERVVIIRQTVIVNRTIIVDGDRDRDRRGRFAVNPGIEPRIVAARTGRPIRVANVKPVVVAGTVGVSSAVEIRGEDARKQRNRTRVQITETKETVQPAKDVPPPQALKKGEEGRFGERPPRAAKEQAQRQQQPDGAKGAAPEATKSGADDAKSKASEDAAKAKAEDSAKSKGADDAAKSKTDDAAKSKVEDTAQSKSRSDEDAKAARSKAPEPKAEPKSQAKEPERSKAEPKQAAPKAEPKSAPEPKQAAPKAERKSAPEPSQAAPKAEPKSAPEPKQAAPKQSAPEPKQVAPRAEPRPAPAPQQAAPKAAPPPQAAPAPQPAAPKAAPPPQAAPKAAPQPQPQGEQEKGKQ